MGAVHSGDQFIFSGEISAKKDAERYTRRRNLIEAYPLVVEAVIQSLPTCLCRKCAGRCQMLPRV